MHLFKLILWDLVCYLGSCIDSWIMHVKGTEHSVAALDHAFAFWSIHKDTWKSVHLQKHPVVSQVHFWNEKRCRNGALLINCNNYVRRYFMSLRIKRYACRQGQQSHLSHSSLQKKRCFCKMHNLHGYCIWGCHLDCFISTSLYTVHLQAYLSHACLKLSTAIIFHLNRENILHTIIALPSYHIALL